MATIISQELFDETLLENEECFDLSPNEALRETMDQFCRQLGHPPCSLRRNNDDDDVNSNDNDSKVTLPQSIPPSMAHLTLTHPSTPAGQVERTNRTNFCHWLTLLDECVGVDGVVTLPSPPPSSATVATASSSSSSLSLVEQGDDNPNVLLEALSHLSIKLQSKNDNNNNNNDGDEEEGGALPYLILFQQSSSIYTLLSFLTTIIPPNDNHDSTSNGNSGNNEGQSIHQPFKLHLLQQTIHTLSSILTSSLKENNVKCTQLRGELRDLFIVGLNRLVSLLWRFVVIVTLENGSVDNDGGENGVEGVTEEEAALENDGADNATTITTTTTSRKKLQTTVLLDLLKLSISAVRGCEGGKVAFVQSTLDASSSSTTTTTRMWNTKRGGVQVIFTILSNTLLNNTNTTTTTSSTNDSSNDDKESTTITNMEIIEATCQLLTTLCRYDDFRTPTSGGGATAAAAAAAGGVSTSSAHDHAMEFHRVGVERLLIKIANGVLNDLLLVYGEGGEEDADDGNETEDEEEEGVLAKKELLAAAVLTALRVLAVNDEIIQTMVALGVLPIVTKALKLSVTATTDTNDEEGSNTRSSSNLFLRKHRLAAGALGLIRNLCGNDEIKTNLCLGSSSNNSTDQQSSSSSSLSISSTPSALPHLLHAMQLYPTISPIQEHACGTLAAMALRRPSNARAIIEEGGPRLIIAAMKRHTENVSVQRQGALAVRNIVSRLLRDLDGGSGGSGDNATASGNTTVEVEDARSAIRDRFGELGVEEVLRNIAGRHQGSVDEAYAALRDLGYSVTLTKFSAEDLQEGNASSNAIGRTMMFGEKHNSNFRPVYEQSAGLSNAVDEAVSNFGA
ncbi:hypothetical protein ACHAWT_007592 [Skeletonema menzelii]